MFVVNNARHRIAFVDVVLVDADEFNGVGRSFLCHACAECHHDISAVARTVECRCVEKTGVFVVGAFIYDADICASAGLKHAVSAPARSVCQLVGDISGCCVSHVGGVGSGFTSGGEFGEVLFEKHLEIRSLVSGLASFAEGFQ